MAPSLISRGALVTARQFYNNNNGCYNNNGDYICNNDRWGSWGRWVFLAAVIAFFVFIALAFSCINSRRRRRAGLSPRYGTGWAAGKTPVGHNAPQYTNYNPPPAPPYTAAPPVYGQNTGNTFNREDGYYGQQTGIELQEPQHVYQQPGGSNGYAPPPGPPPANAKN